MKKFLAAILAVNFLFMPVFSTADAAKNPPDHVVLKPNKYKPHETPKPPQIKRDKKILPPQRVAPTRRGLGDPPPPPYPNKKYPPAPQPEHGRRFIPPALRK